MKTRVGLLTLGTVAAAVLAVAAVAVQAAEEPPPAVAAEMPAVCVEHMASMAAMHEGMNAEGMMGGGGMMGSPMMGGGGMMGSDGMMPPDQRPALDEMGPGHGAHHPSPGGGSGQ
jgi:hypothetical protein